MKRVIFVAVFLFLLSIPIVSNAAIASSSSLNDIKVYVISNDECKNCDSEKEWLKEIRSEYVRLSIYDIDINSDEELVKKVKELLSIQTDNVPITIIGTNYFIGFDDNLKEQIKTAISSYYEKDNYCDIITKLQNNEDTKGCIKLNEGIYNQASNSSSLVLKVLIPIVIVSIIIVTIVILRNKKKNKA